MGSFRLSEYPHSYGSNVHLLCDPVHEKLLARFCSETTIQPEITHIAKTLSRFLMSQAVNHLFPQQRQKLKTRMAAAHPEAIVEADLLRSDSRAVAVDLMRAGILPSQTCFESLHEFLAPENIRQDHILLNRQTDGHEKVIGVQLSGHKIGGPIERAFVFLADPMGATGGTIESVIKLYTDLKLGVPEKFIALHFILTPEYLKRVQPFSKQLEIFTLRLDRGLSSKEILKSGYGEKWDQERGLNSKQYIVPGAGGIGELLNNSFV